MKQFRIFLTLALLLSTTVPSQACCLFPWLTYRPNWGYAPMYGGYPAYGGYGYGNNCGCYSPCNPCGTCATGTCGATSTRKEPAPDTNFESNGNSSTQDDTPRTFRREDENGVSETEIDDFRRLDQEKWKEGRGAGGTGDGENDILNDINNIDDLNKGSGDGAGDIPGLNGEFNTNKPAQEDEDTDADTEPPVEIDHETRKPEVTIPKEEGAEQETGAVEFLGPEKTGHVVRNHIRSSQFEVLPISRMAGRKSTTQLTRKPVEEQPTLRWISVPTAGRVRL